MIWFGVCISLLRKRKQKGAVDSLMLEGDAPGAKFKTKP